MQKNSYGTSIFNHLKLACSNEWRNYCHHEFVDRVGDGTLPIHSFRLYLEQDYAFLTHFSRAWALAAYKSSTIRDMKWASQILHSTLTVEMDLHVRFSERFGVSQSALENVAEHQENLAYTRYVLDKGQSGDLLDLYVALIPCVVGYAEIGVRLELDFAATLAENPYREWIEMYAGEDYQALAIRSISNLERISAERGGNARIEQLIDTYRQATVLETAFWQMCLQSD